mgnify:CR=1 FL=1
MQVIIKRDLFDCRNKIASNTDADGQLFSYMSATSAQGGFWTNGNKISFYRKDATTGNIIPWLGIPKYEQAWDSVGKYKKSDLIVPVDLKLAFRRCHNAIYRSGIDSEDIALDMVRIILSKIEDEASAKEECDFHITPEEFKDEQARDTACLRVRKLFEAVRDRYTDVFHLLKKLQRLILNWQLLYHSFNSIRLWIRLMMLLEQRMRFMLRRI